MLTTSRVVKGSSEVLEVALGWAVQDSADSAATGWEAVAWVAVVSDWAAEEGDSVGAMEEAVEAEEEDSAEDSMPPLERRLFRLTPLPPIPPSPAPSLTPRRGWRASTRTR